MLKVVAVPLLLASVAWAQAVPAPQLAADDRLYRAALSAADARLRLHETAAARRWLAEAPEARRGWEWRYLGARADESLRSFLAHERGVSCVDVSPDGALLATASADASAKLWEASSGRLLHTLSGHTAGVWVARFSPDGKEVATASSDGTVRIWEVATGQERSRLDGVSQGIAAVAWHPSGRELAATGWRRSRERGVWGLVTVWQPATSGRREIEHGIKPIVTVAYSPDGARLAAGTWDFDVAVWDTAAWGAPVILVPPQSTPYKAVNALAWSSDGARLAVGAKDGTTRVWDVAARSLVHTLSGQAEGKAQSVNAVVFSPGGDRLLAAQGDGTVRVWRANDGAQEAVLHAHAGPVAAIAQAGGGESVITGGADGTVRFWRGPGGAAGSPGWLTREIMYDAAFAPGGGRVAVTGWTGTVEIRDARTGAIERSWAGHGQSGVRVAWSHDARWLVTTGNDGKVVLWDAITAERLRELAAIDGPQLTGLAMHPSEAIVAAQTVAGTVQVWELPSGAALRTLADGQRELADLAFSPDGRVLAVGGRDGAVALWEWRSGTLQRRLEHGRGSTHPAWRPDGTMLAVGGGDRTISLWAAATGERLGTLSGHDGSVNAVRFSPDGRRIASASADQSACVWDPAGSGPLLCVPFAEQVYSLAWSPDGSRLLTLPLARELVWLDSVPARDRAAVPDAGARR